ncbi:MAG: inositol monophosphatase family protein [Nitrospirota bacterium]
MNILELEEIKKTAIKAVQKGGEILKRGLEEDIRIDYKGAINLVTDIDRRSEEAIIGIIKKSFPEHDILAEEGGEKRGSLSDYKWIIDPLDGTTNYAHRFPCFCISIGVEVNGEILIGLVYDPARDELFLAEKGKGAYLNGRPIHVSSIDSLIASLLVTGFSYDIRDSSKNNFEHFCNMSLHAQGVRRTGSAAIDLCYVAMGRLDGFWELKLSPWDVAAGYLIVTESGGKVTDFFSNSFSVYSKEILATNGRIHDGMLKILQKENGCQVAISDP